MISVVTNIIVGVCCSSIFVASSLMHYLRE